MASCVEAGERAVAPEVAARWEREQEELKARLVEEDGEEVRGWRGGEEGWAGLHHVAGVDISFDKGNPLRACAMLVVLSFPALEVVHVSREIVEMTEPYVSGFLAFREVGFLLKRLEEVCQSRPEVTPQVILVDGNGVLHCRGFGLASHLGVLSGIPTVGVAKKLCHVDGLESSRELKAALRLHVRRKGDHLALRGQSGRVWGEALLTSDEARNPVYVSVGHKINLSTAVALVTACSIKRIPEPIRQADIQSRAELREATQDASGRKKQAKKHVPAT